MTIIVLHFSLLLFSCMHVEEVNGFLTAYDGIGHLYPITSAVENHESLINSASARSQNSRSLNPESDSKSSQNRDAPSNQAFASSKLNNLRHRSYLANSYEHNHHFNHELSPSHYPPSRSYKSSYSPNNHIRRDQLNKPLVSVFHGGPAIRGRRYWLAVEDFIKDPLQKNPQSQWYFYPIMTDNRLQPVYHHSHIHSHVGLHQLLANHNQIDTKNDSDSNVNKRRKMARDKGEIELETSTAKPSYSDSSKTHQLGNIYHSLGGDHFAPRIQPFPEYILGTILRVDSDNKGDNIFYRNPYHFTRSGDSPARGNDQTPLRQQFYPNAVPSYLQVAPNYQGYHLTNVKSHISVPSSSKKHDGANNHRQPSTTTSSPSTARKRQQSRKTSTVNPTRHTTTARVSTASKHKKSHEFEAYTSRPTGYLPDYLPGYVPQQHPGYLPGQLPEHLPGHHPGQESKNLIETPVRGRLIHIRS